MNNSSIVIQGLVQVAKWLSSLVLLGTGLSLTVFIFRILGQDKFKLGQIEFKLKHFPWVIAGLSVGHAYLSWIFSLKVAALHAFGVIAERSGWSALVQSEAFIFNEMQPRLLVESGTLLGQVYVANSKDPAFWLTFAFAATLLLAVVACLSPPIELLGKKENRHKIPGMLAVACALASINWVIGSSWAIHASSLANP